MKKTIILFVSVALLGTGCAQKADSIKATYVSPITYEKLSCNQLKDEVIRVNKRLTEVSGQQAEVADKDAVVMGVGLVVFWPALFLMAQGEDQKNEIASLKGQYETIRDVAVKKNCSFAAGMR
jgi:hypothetical protein